MSDDKIQEKILKDSTLGAVIAPIDVNNILKLVDNGASKEDLAKAATGIALGKVLQGKKNATSQTDANEQKRPSHRDSEKDVGKDLGEGWREQVSFKDGKEVKYGTKDSVRPDWCKGSTCSVEVKNYNISKNSNGLIDNVSKQAIQRQKNLPEGMKQEVVIDIRGQNVSSAEKRAIVKGIVEKSNGALKATDIQFKGE